jgi:hypothetical protein
MNTRANETVRRADGFVELGMIEEAESELARLPGIELVEPASVAVRLKIAARKGDWERASGLAHVLEHAEDRSFLQACAEFHRAYARHLCQTGKVVEAKEHVATASLLWPDIHFMLEDPGLADLW